MLGVGKQRGAAVQIDEMSIGYSEIWGGGKGRSRSVWHCFTEEAVEVDALAGCLLTF